MSHGGGGLTEKLEHSTLVDLIQIGVYAYFAYAFYTTLGYGDTLLKVTTEPNVLALQLAIGLIGLNLLMLIHDRVRGSSSSNPLA
jgi:hypothetical protein